MKVRNDENGALNMVTFGLIFGTLLFVISVGFGLWAFVSRQDYKNNSDQKVAAAVEVAKKEEAAKKDNEYLEKEKYPLKTYRAPDALGGITMSYPKTWSAYISSDNNNFFIFNPDIVTARNNPLYALRITVESQPYAQIVEQYNSRISQGKLSAKAYSLPKVPSVVGARFDGEIEIGKPGAVVILPLRDKTIKIACEIPDRLADFDRIILPNLTFNP